MDLTFMSGELIWTHDGEACTPPCPIHGASDHHMATWGLRWNPDLRSVERVCVHGQGHPDPDSLYGLRQHLIHFRDGCCGCCRL
jgi:hypothetical protein